MTLRPSDVVLARLPGAHVTKLRPAVVLSTESYQAARPDVIIGLVTSQSLKNSTAFDYQIQNWQSAGLKLPSTFRLYVATALQSQVTTIGRLSDDDWQEVQSRLKLGLAFA